MKIMGAITNPLFQNKKRMVAAGLCTGLQYKAGKAELIRRVAHAFDRIDGAQEVVHVSIANRNGIRWSSSDDDGNIIAIVTQSSKKAVDELDL
ncbi:hypothetical protein ACHAXR_001760 [Thalassiosira sp. AJA248-18]